MVQSIANAIGVRVEDLEADSLWFESRAELLCYLRTLWLAIRCRFSFPRFPQPEGNHLRETVIL
jgi:hypothetical protein